METTDTRPLVSAVIPTHNRRELLERAVKSVLAQTYSPIEVIIVDDRSTDDTEEYVGGLRQKYPQIHYVKIPVGEPGSNNSVRNIGIDAARGEWIAFLDDDDVWLKDKIEKQMEYVQQHRNIGAVSCASVNLFVTNKGTIKYVSRPQPHKEPNGFFADAWINVTSTLMISKAVLLEVGKFDETLPAMQELELSYRICAKYDVECLETPLVEYYNYIGTVKQITSGTEKFIKAHEMVEKKYEAELGSLSSEQKKRREMAYIRGLAERYYRGGDRRMLRKTLRPVLSQSGIFFIGAYFMSYFMEYGQYRYLYMKCSPKNMFRKRK